jgi:hypothetical protein
MARTLPAPRPVPSVGFGVPQIELYRACQRLFQDGQQAEIQERAEHAHLVTKLGFHIHYTPSSEVEVYSSAVHIFAAMTAEAVMNVYAVVRYGDAHFDRNFRYGNPVKRLREILHYLPELDLADTSEIVLICQRLFDVRDKLVHAKSSEDHFDGQGKRITPPEIVNISQETAAIALSDLERFIQLMISFDAEIAPFLEAI